DEVRRHPHGAFFDDAVDVLATPADDDAHGRFEVAPTDVAEELAQLADAITTRKATDGMLRLAVRRRKHVINSTGTQIASLMRQQANPCCVHPDDLARLGLADGDDVTISTDHGTVDAVVRADSSLRCGVVTLTHGFGGRGSGTE